MSVVAYLVYLLLVALYVVILKDATAIFTIQINLPALLVMLVALYKDEVTATWFGFFAGLVAIAGGPPAELGWQAGFMAALAVTAGLVRKRLNLDAMWARLLYILGGIMVHNLFLLILSQSSNFLLHLVVYVLAGALYTSAPAWIFFLIKDRRLTFQRIKAVF